MKAALMWLDMSGTEPIIRRPGGTVKYCFVFLAVGCLLTAVHAQWLETKIQVGNDPDEQLYVPFVDKVYCTNDDDNSVSIVDCATNTVRRTIYAPQLPVAVAYSDVYNRVYIACEFDSTIVVVDAVGDTVVASLRCGAGPSAAAYCRALGKVYVMCLDGGRIDVVDAAGDSIIRHINVPLDGVAIEWCPTSDLVFFANGRGDSMTVIDCNTDKVRALRAGYSAFDQVHWNQVDGRVYTCEAYAIHVFNASGDSLIGSISHPAYTPGMCFAPYPNKCFIGDFNTGVVYVTDCNTRSITDSIQTDQVYSMVLDSLCGKMYVVQSHNGVAVLDARGDSIVTQVPFTQYPSGPIAWSARERRAYVPGYYTDTLYVITDTALGIAERAVKAGVRMPNAPTVIRGAIWLAPSTSSSSSTSCLLDVSGRKVIELHAGANDVSGLAPGVYFVREAQAQAQAQAVRKVVITR